MSPLNIGFAELIIVFVLGSAVIVPLGVLFVVFFRIQKDKKEVAELKKEIAELKKER